MALQTGLPGATTGSAILASFFSVVVSALGLVLLRVSRPSKVSGSRAQHFLLQALGLVGVLCVFTGLIMRSIPHLVGVATDAEGKAAFLIESLLIPLSWACERFLVAKRPLPLVHSVACVGVWFGVTLVDWFGPRPYDNMTIGLAGQIGGCDGRYRSPFLIYAAIWITVITFGGILIFLEDNPLFDFCDEAHGRYTSNYPFRRKALPAVFGFAMSMSGVAFSIGVASDNMFMVFYASLLLVLATLATWDWLWRLDLPLGSWVPLSIGASTIARVAQEHLIFRDLRWDPVNEVGFFTVWKWPGLAIFLFGASILVFALLVCIAGSDSMSWFDDEHDLEDEDDAGSVASLDYDRELTPCNFGQLCCLLICVVALLAGNMIPMYKSIVHHPALMYQGPERNTTVGGDPPGSKGPAVNSKSMLETITLLYDHRMPCSALVIAWNSVIVPPLQFASILVLIFRPRWIPAAFSNAMYPQLLETLMGQGTFRFANPVVVAMMVAFANFAFERKTGELLQCEFCLGYAFFMVYCFTSVILAQTLECQFLEEGFGNPRARTISDATPSGRPVEAIEENDFDDIDGASIASAKSIGRPSNVYGSLIMVAVTIPLVGIAFTFALVFPFLSFNLRISGIVVHITEPSLFDIWIGLVGTNYFLGWFAAFTFAGTFFIWLLLFVFSLPFILGLDLGITILDVAWLIRQAERLVRPWVMTHVWSMMVFSLYYVVTSRNKAIIEVCVSFPSQPWGLLGVAIVCFGSQSLINTARALSPEGIAANRRREAYAPKLAGGCLVWGVAPIVVLVTWILLLYATGPLQKPELSTVQDINNWFEGIVPIANSLLQTRIPHSSGDCEARWKHRVATGEALFNDEEAVHRDCAGKSPLTEISRHNGPSAAPSVNVTARWVDGWNSIVLTKIDITKPPPQGDVMVWNVTATGYFGDLHVWLKVMLGSEPWVDDFMCCKNPFHLTVRASATCSETQGYNRPVAVDVIEMDSLNWVQKEKWPEPPGTDVQVVVDYGQFEAVERAIHNILLGKRGKFWLVRADESLRDPLSGIAEILESIVNLNGESMCGDLL